MTIDTKTLRICALAHADANHQATAQLLMDVADQIDGLTKHNEYLLARLRKQGQQLDAIDAGGGTSQQQRCAPVAYFQNTNSLNDQPPLYEQVCESAKDDLDVFPLYASPQSAYQIFGAPVAVQIDPDLIAALQEAAKIISPVTVTKEGAGVFINYGDEEERMAEYQDNACPHCGGSGHKDDVSPTHHGESSPVGYRWRHESSDRWRYEEGKPEPGFDKLHDIELLYTAQQDRQNGEPDYYTYVANGTTRHISDSLPPDDAYDDNTLEGLYTAPQPVESACDMVAACCGRSECGGECGNEWRGMIPATPAQEPSDEDIERLAAEHLSAHAQFVGAGEVHYEGEVEFARTLLARYGRGS